MKTPILTLDAFAPQREHVAIRLSENDVRNYEMRNHNELSIDQLAKIKRVSEDSLGLIDKEGNPDAEGIAAMARFLDETLDVVLVDLDPDIKQRLHLAQKIAIIQVFFGLAPMTGQGREAQETGSPETGAQT